MRPRPEVRTFRHKVIDDVLDVLTEAMPILMPYDNKDAKIAQDIMIRQVYNCLAHWLRIIEEAYNEEE